MHRFFFEPKNITPHEIKILDKGELHHLRDVLRFKERDKVTAIDGSGREFFCEINSIDKNCARLKILEKREQKIRDLSPRLTIACAMPKGLKIDFIVEKLTEIGVQSIIFLKTERTQVNLKDVSRKITRLKKIAQSSLKQSGNLFIPDINFLNFGELIKLKSDNNFDLALIANLRKDTKNLINVLEENPAKNILITIGPEGDFSEKEVKLANQAGFISVSLGDAILKVDTAAIVAAGFVKLLLTTPHRK